MSTTSTEDVLNLSKSCDKPMAFEQKVRHYFSHNPFREAYFNYLHADADYFREKAIQTVCKQKDASEGIHYLPSDNSLFFYAALQNFRTGVLQEPCYKVLTCIPFERDSFSTHWTNLRNTLLPGIYEVQKDYILQEEWQNIIRAGAFSPGIVLKMVLKKKDCSYPIELPADMNIRLITNNDWPYVREIVKEYKENHLFHSPFIDPSRTSKLFQNWLEYSTQKMGSQVYILTKGHEIIGVLNCLQASGFSGLIGKEVGVIDFIMLRPDQQGKRYADYLLNYALHEVFSRAEFVELQTCLKNLAAVNFYSRHTFRILDRRIVLHFKIAAPKGADEWQN